MNEKSVIIIGAGGHAKVLLDILLDTDAKVLGFLDSDASLRGTEIFGIPVLGMDDEIARYSPLEVELVNGIGSVGVVTLRRKIFDKFKDMGFRFRQVIHPSAIISNRATLGEGVQIMAGAVINIGTCIGDDSIINTKASVDHDCNIGRHVHIAPGCTLCGGVSVGDGTMIGTGSSVIQGISIGKRCLVGAGSNVFHFVPDESKGYGNPMELADKKILG